MELLTNPKAEYLLGASLDVLHAESREWLSEISFTSEEIACYYKLLHKNKPFPGFPTSELAEMEKEMIRISSEELTKVKNRVERHERELAALMNDTSATEEYEYRHQHRVLVGDMFTLRGNIRKFKEAVFSLVKAY
jgi:hypothetical protein